MTIHKDLTGKRYGELQVIARDTNGSTGIYRYICKCDCGNNVTLSVAALMLKGTKNCGCKDD